MQREDTLEGGRTLYDWALPQEPQRLSEILRATYHPLCGLSLCPQDQVDHLLALKVRVSSLNSKLSAQEKKELLSDLEQEKPWTKILYITPEMAAAASFQPTLNSLVSRHLLSYLVVELKLLWEEFVKVWHMSNKLTY